MISYTFFAFQEVVKADFNDERLQRSPTFTTSSGEESSHDSAITGLKPLPEVSSTLEGGYGDTFQIGRKIMHPLKIIVPNLMAEIISNTFSTITFIIENLAAQGAARLPEDKD